ncbi:MAG: DNA polymerase I [Oscillospiraceae bacterium]|jgi:DNA polymerase-1|nr:DNA polymerase I [Oscillospiraceae bacterium]
MTHGDTGGYAAGEVRPLCLAIDGNSLMYRAYHALPESLTDPHGNPTNAVFGFMTMLIKLLAERRPAALAVAFDVHGPTRRHLKYAAYKGTRPPTPETLRPQFPTLKSLLGSMGIAMLALEGWEADDLLGTLSRQCEERGMRSLIVTGDRDSFQLISGGTRVLFTRKGVTDTVELDPAALKESYGVSPSQVPDLKGLMGDASDNIPGISGIGEKTALKLLERYGTLRSALAGANEQKGKLRERLETGVESATLSLDLATIDRNAPIDIDWPSLMIPSIRDLCVKSRPVLAERGFNSIVSRLDAIIAGEGGAEPSAPREVSAERSEPSERAVVTLGDLDALRRFARERKVNAAAERPAALAFGESLTFADEAEARIVPLANDLLSEGVQPEDALKVVKSLLDDPEPWILADAKAIFTQSGADVKPGSRAAWDAALASALMGGRKAGALEDISAGELFNLAKRQRAELDQMGSLELYETVELPLTGVLIGMERAGFLLNRDELEAIGRKLGAYESSVREEIFGEMGTAPFNLNSPKQLGKALFEDLGLPSGRKTKSGYSTDAETLETLAESYPVAAKILDWRQTVKLRSTYIDGLLSKLDPQGRVHSTFLQTAAITGRISSNEPNLQNIPTRTERGREIRRAFAAPEGWTLVDADYSQIELRILAHLAEDPRMIDAFANGGDIHAAMAAEVNGVAIGDVTSAMRSAAKAVNFGIVYGQSDYGLARSLGVTRQEAAAMIERYFARYPNIRLYLDECVAQGKRRGYVRTIMGRRRLLPELSSPVAATRKFGERAAMNAPVQGSAADIIKLAMVRVAEALRGMRSRLILQVHDELILESPEDEAETAAAILKEQMQGAARLRVPLAADVGIGKTWYDSK